MSKHGQDGRRVVWKGRQGDFMTDEHSVEVLIIIIPIIYLILQLMSEICRKKLKRDETKAIKKRHLSILNKILSGNGLLPDELLFSISKYIFSNPLTFSTPLYLSLSRPFFLNPGAQHHFIINTNQFQNLIIDFFWVPLQEPSQKNNPVQLSVAHFANFLKLFQPGTPSYLSRNEKNSKKEMSLFKWCICSMEDQMHLQNIGVYIIKGIMNKVIASSISQLMSRKIIFFKVSDKRCIWVIKAEEKERVSIQQVGEQLLKEKKGRIRQSPERDVIKIYVRKQRVRKWGRQKILIKGEEVQIQDCYIEQI